jgi:tripartite-type tricarboxylate transporter receptor subunit TctC
LIHRRSLIGATAAAGLLPAVSRAQSFPSKQLRLIVGFAAGGGGDIVARVLGAELTKSGGYSVLVDNKPGAGGNIAMREALRAAPDGHAILFANVGMLAVNPYAMKDVGYDPATDIAPVCLAVDFSNVLVVHPSVPAKTLAEYLELAKRSPFDPDIPTIAEQGFPGYAATNWYAIVVSSKVPPEIVAQLNAILTKALKAQEVQAAYAQQGMETIASTQAETAAHIARETEVWKKVIADAGIRLE